jgi:hypothetical protein
MTGSEKTDRRFRPLARWGALGWAVLALVCVAAAIPSKEATVEELKARLSGTSIPERPQLCVEIADKQLDEAARLYAAVETKQAEAALVDVTAFAELARDYAIQSHKRQKQTEIAVRRMTRRLTDLKRNLSREEQPPVREALDRLQRVRDDLLAAMFPKKVGNDPH